MTTVTAEVQSSLLLFTDSISYTKEQGDLILLLVEATALFFFVSGGLLWWLRG